MTGPAQAGHDLLKPRGRVMEMPGVGELRDIRFFSGSATAEPLDGRTLALTVTGLFHRVYRATDPAGGVVGEYRRTRAWKRDGELTWNGREYALVQNGTWTPVFALRRAERDLLTLKAYAMGPRRVSARHTGLEEVEPGLELFCAWLVHRFAQEDAAVYASS